MLPMCLKHTSESMTVEEITHRLLIKGESIPSTDNADDSSNSVVSDKVFSIGKRLMEL